MSIIIRLQNLPLSASSLDIRRFFTGLLIPDGGVHIIGGADKIAFIAFSTDEDARQAMARQHEALIKDTKIQLFLSSRSEMKQVIDKARSQNVSRTTTSSSTVASSSSVNNQQQRGNSQPPISLEHSAAPNNLNQQQAIGQLNFAAVHPPTGNIANLVANLQEPTEYRRRRSRSPADARYAAGDRQLREPGDPNTHRVKHMMEQARLMESRGASPGGSVRSRLGGFDLPPTNHGNNSNYPYHLGMNRWNNGQNQGANGNAASAYDHSQGGSAALLMTPQTHQNNSSRFLNANHPNHSFYPDNQSISPNHQHLNGSGLLPMNQPPPNRYIIELRGLPKNVQTVNIQSFFRPVGVQVSRDQIKLSVDERRGEFNGTAHLIFHNQADAENALLLSGRSIGNEPIQVIPIGMENGGGALHPPLDYPLNGNLDMLNQPPNYSAGPRTQESYSRRKEMYPIFMKGLPYQSCNKPAVEAFFSPIPLFEVIIITERSGRPTGNAYVIVETKENYELAMSRHMNYMDSRYIELFTVGMDEVENYLQRLEYRQGAAMGIHSNSGAAYPDSPEQQMLHRKRKRFEPTTYCVQMRGLPPQVDNQDLTAFFLERGSTAHAVHMLRQNGRNAGECFVEFKDLNSLTKALKLDQQWMRDCRLSIREIPYPKVCEIVGIKPPGTKHFKQDSDKERPPYNETRCTVVAKIPSRATKSDLVAFFSDFNVNQNQIDWKLDQDGQKTDEALVRFRSEGAARRAIQKLDKKYFIDRHISLRPL